MFTSSSHGFRFSSSMMSNPKSSWTQYLQRNGSPLYRSLDFPGNGAERLGRHALDLSPGYLRLRPPRPVPSAVLLNSRSLEQAKRSAAFRGWVQIRKLTAKNRGEEREEREANPTNLRLTFCLIKVLTAESDLQIERKKKAWWVFWVAAINHFDGNVLTLDVGSKKKTAGTGAGLLTRWWSWRPHPWWSPTRVSGWCPSSSGSPRAPSDSTCAPGTRSRPSSPCTHPRSSCWCCSSSGAWICCWGFSWTSSTWTTNTQFEQNVDFVFVTFCSQMGSTQVCYSNSASPVFTRRATFVLFACKWRGPWSPSRHVYQQGSTKTVPNSLRLVDFPLFGLVPNSFRQVDLEYRLTLSLPIHF